MERATSLGKGDPTDPPRSSQAASLALDIHDAARTRSGLLRRRRRQGAGSRRLTNLCAGDAGSCPAFRSIAFWMSRTLFSACLRTLGASCFACRVQYHFHHSNSPTPIASKVRSNSSSSWNVPMRLLAAARTRKVKGSRFSSRN
jgi:hypothetical protein